MNDELFSVKDQVVIVSGGSRGIGRAIVAEFVKREAKVIATGRDQSALEETMAATKVEGNQAECVICDVLKKSEIDHTVHNVLDKAWSHRLPRKLRGRKSPYADR